MAVEVTERAASNAAWYEWAYSVTLEAGDAVDVRPAVRADILTRAVGVVLRTAPASGAVLAWQVQPGAGASITRARSLSPLDPLPDESFVTPRINPVITAASGDWEPAPFSALRFGQDGGERSTLTITSTYPLRVGVAAGPVPPAPPGTGTGTGGGGEAPMPTDLSDYFTRDEVDALLAALRIPWERVDGKPDLFTRGEVEELLEGYYTKSEADALLTGLITAQALKPFALADNPGVKVTRTDLAQNQQIPDLTPGQQMRAGDDSLLEAFDPPAVRNERVIARSTPLPNDLGTSPIGAAIPGLAFQPVAPFASNDDGTPEQPYRIPGSDHIRIHLFARATGGGVTRGQPLFPLPEYDDLLGWWLSSWIRTGSGDSAVDTYQSRVALPFQPDSSGGARSWTGMLWVGLPASTSQDGTLVRPRLFWGNQWNQLVVQAYQTPLPAGAFFEISERRR